MKIGIIDFETTGLDTETLSVTEIGFILINEDKEILNMQDYLIKQEHPLDPKITELTGLTDEMLTMGLNLEQVLDRLFPYLQVCDYFCGHNSSRFDELIFRRIWAEYATEDKLLLAHDIGSTAYEDTHAKEWIDTSKDIPYPQNITTRKLLHLGAEHGYLNTGAHRALFDCLACLHLLKQYDFEKILNHKNQKEYHVLVKTVSPHLDGGDSKDFAKANGFRWNPDSKTWTRSMKENELENFKQNYPDKEITAKELSQ